MADPDHIPELDTFDRLTVGLYRTGLVAGALGLIAMTVTSGWGQSTATAQVAVLFGVALSVANMHLYDKRVRWVIHVAGWTGATLTAGSAMLPAAAAHWVGHAGLGFLFVVLSALALKERFCFRLPGLRAVPLLLAGSLLPMVAGTPWVSGLMLGPAALLFSILAVAKLRMPLHFDVGDKSRYQV